MHKRDLDHLLEAAVAKALNVKLPVHHRPHRATRKRPVAAERMSHAA